MASARVDLNGDWIGYYKGHHDEVVRIRHDGNEVEAVKVTGDSHVPAGEVTFRALLAGSQGTGEGQVAAPEFHSPKFIPGTLRVMDVDHLVFEWTGLGEVEFRRDV